MGHVPEGCGTPAAVQLKKSSTNVRGSTRASMLKSVRYQVGHWTFVPSAHELRSGGARARLQQRASATLSLLCERAGEVVSRQEIIDRAWGRRHLSANSVAIVIGD